MTLYSNRDLKRRRAQIQRSASRTSFPTRNATRPVTFSTPGRRSCLGDMISGIAKFTAAAVVIVGGGIVAWPYINSFFSQYQSTTPRGSDPILDVVYDHNVEHVAQNIIEHFILQFKQVGITYNGEPLTVSSDQVYLATDFSAIFDQPSATNQLFTVSMQPFTLVQNNSGKQLVLYNRDGSKHGDIDPEKPVNLEGVLVSLQPRLNLSDYSVSRTDAVDVYGKAELSVTHPEDKKLTGLPGDNSTLASIMSFLQGAVNAGATAADSNYSVLEIDLETTINLSMPYTPSIVVTPQPITDVKFEDAKLQDAYSWAQKYLWFTPAVGIADYATNREGVIDAFNSIGYNFPNWSEQVRSNSLRPSNAQLPRAVLPDISGGVNSVDLTMPGMFEDYWRNVTQDPVLDLYMAMIKLTINSGVGSKSSCSTRPDVIAQALSGTNVTNPSIPAECVFTQTATLTVHVPNRYVNPLQDMADTYIADQRALFNQNQQGIDFNNVKIKVTP